MEPIEVIIRAGNHDRRACPVWVQLPLENGTPVLRMTDEAGNEVPCQAEPSGTGPEDRLWLTWIVRDLGAGQQRRYRIEEAGNVQEATDRPAGEGGEVADRAADMPSPAPAVVPPPGTALSVGVALPEQSVAGGVVLTELADGTLSVTIDGEVFTYYHFSSDVARPYFYPVIGPTGKGVTRDFPMVPPRDGSPGKHPYDHPHHRSIWIAHGDVNGTDNWSEGANHSTQRHAGFSRLISGPVYGSFDATTEWMDRDGRVVMEETRRVTFFNVGPEERLIDMSLRFTATSGTVTFGDTKEGGLVSVRVASSMDAPDKNRPDAPGRIENSYSAVGEAETWGKRAMWCDYSGPVDGEVAGITLMDHPTNPRYPTHWHVRAYGLMTANPFGLHDFYKDPDTHRGDWTIPAYESRNFLYRLLIHRGDVQHGNVRERYHDFVNVPVVELAQ
jgi:hypothetical protein